MFNYICCVQGENKYITKKTDIVGMYPISLFLNSFPMRNRACS